MTASTPNRPNLLIIHTDQQSRWTLSCYGGAVVDTPNIDRLAAEGVRCDNHFDNSAVCTPSRGVLLTGRYPHCNGAYTNSVELNRDEITLAQVLKDAGYDTGYLGKWHLDGPKMPGWVSRDRSMGFDDCEFMFNCTHPKAVHERPDGHPILRQAPGDEEHYTTDWLTNKTIDFLRRPRSKPFFLMTGIPDPHQPYIAREPYASMFDPADMPIPETFHLEDNKMPAWGRKARDTVWNTNIPHEWVTTREDYVRKARAQYCGMVKHIDDSVGRILDALEAEGRLDDTLIVFTTDHGDYMGELGLMFKNHMYESVYRIPMILRYPGRLPAGRAVDEVMSNVDFQQTVLSLMGVAPCGREQGEDASAVLAGDAEARATWKNEAMLYHPTHDFAGIATPRYELVFDRVDGDHALFDRLEDPQQTRNLYHEPTLQDTVAELTRRVVEHHESVDSPETEFLSALAPA